MTMTAPTRTPMVYGVVNHKKNGLIALASFLSGFSFDMEARGEEETTRLLGSADVAK